MEKTLTAAIFKTLAYADIFDYPLTATEVWRFLITQKKTKAKGVQVALARMSADLKLTDTEKGFYFLQGRETLVNKRQKRERWSREKLKRAVRATRILKLIPTVKMVGLTGNLAAGNCDRKDDIDLLIVTSAETLWLTRFLATFLLEILGQRRHPGQKEVQDKICLNMFIDENHLEIPLKEQDLYTAHEVAQLKPLWDRDGTYQKFLMANLWAKRYLPNGLDIRILRYYDIKKKKKKSLNISIAQSLSIFERLARHFQLWYMRKRRTTEVVSEGVIRFHPQDARVWILREFQKRLQNSGLDK